MTIAKRLVAAVLLAIFTAPLVAGGPKEDGKEDAKQLQGTWQVTKFIDSSERQTFGSIGDIGGILADILDEYRHLSVFLNSPDDTARIFLLEVHAKPLAFEALRPLERKEAQILCASAVFS